MERRGEAGRIIALRLVCFRSLRHRFRASPCPRLTVSPFLSPLYDCEKSPALSGDNLPQALP